MSCRLWRVGACNFLVRNVGECVKITHTRASPPLLRCNPVCATCTYKFSTTVNQVYSDPRLLYLCCPAQVRCSGYVCSMLHIVRRVLVYSGSRLVVRYSVMVYRPVVLVNCRCRCWLQVTNPVSDTFYKAYMFQCFGVW